LVSTIYWLLRTATSSARLYREGFTMGVTSVRLEIPEGVSVYPRFFHELKTSFR